MSLFTAAVAHAGGPKYVAGVSYFNPGVQGQALVWANGQLNYYVDQGPLNSSISNAQAVAMVDAAAAVWNGVPTAAVVLTDQGSLAEDVNGSNIQAGTGVFVAPADVTPAATGTPVGVIFDADGSVIDALEGVGASEPDNCVLNGVLMWLDAFNPNATFGHGLIVLNGRCATSAALDAMMSYQLERAFGRLLGLDFSQVNDGALQQTLTEPNAVLGWPVMDPLSGTCGAAGGTCISNPTSLRMDDIAALNRMYPVTAANQASFPGKAITAANTVSIQGTISFRNGQGMQGVNVVARPIDANGNPLYQYTVTFVSGSYFCGNHGNEVTGFTDGNRNQLDRFGSGNAAMEGFFDLSGIPLPLGMPVANYQVSFEEVNPLYILAISVGPYTTGSPSPSGTLAVVTVSNMQAGGAQTVTVNVANSASQVSALPLGEGISEARESANEVHAGSQVVEGKLVHLGRRKIAGVRPVLLKTIMPGAAGSESNPTPLPLAGQWTSRLGQVGQNDWFSLPVRANRIFTIVTQAMNETGVPSALKAMPAIGIWDGFDQVGTSPVGFTTAQNGLATGETWLQVATAGNDIVRFGVVDERGDGRPDYAYRGWVLYADTVAPVRIPAAGGMIVIRGTGFRSWDTVQVGGVEAQVTSVLPTEITAVVPPAGAGVTGSLDVEVDDLPNYTAAAVITAGVSYDAGSGDGLTLVTAPTNLVPMGVPQPFAVVAKGANLSPAGGVTVRYSVTSGTAALGCGLTLCAVTATGDGLATLGVTATSSSLAVVTASLTNGASLQAQFFGGAAPSLNALTPTLYLAAGATAAWPVQALALSGGAPVAGQQVAWKTVAGIAGSAAIATNSAGIAGATLIAGPLVEGQSVASNACLNGGSTCVPFNVFGSRPEYAALTAISGTSQSLQVGTAAALVAMRVLDMNGHAMAGATVTVSQALYAWAPLCPRHGRCAQPQLLATQATTVTSALDGSFTVTPLTLAGSANNGSGSNGVATNLIGLATTGNAGSLGFVVEEHP